MACFIVPTVEAIVVTAARKVMEKKEKASGEVEVRLDGAPEKAVKIPFSAKLKWLTNLLWGGSVLLAFEHVWHGEVVPWFPFLTAMNDPADTAAMLQEMATIGVTMAGIVTGVWGAMCLAADAIVKRSPKATAEKAPV